MNVRVALSLTASALFTIALLASGCGGCGWRIGDADLSLSMSVSNPAPAVGDTITFTTILTNGGPEGASDVQVQDFLPAGLTFVSAVPSQGTYNNFTGVWTVGSLPVGTPQTLSIAATLTSTSTQTSTATIASVDQVDPNPANNTASVSVSTVSDLSLSKGVTDSAPNVGDTITFTVTLTNHGPSLATNVEVQDLLPAGLSFVSAAATLGSYVSATGVWTVGTVAVSTPQTLIIAALVVSATARTNTATISNLDQSDPNAANDTANVTETPQQADLSLIKIVSNPTPNVGDTITFTVTLTNLGPDAATNVQVVDLLPIGLTFVSAIPSQGSYDSTTGVWDVGTVTVASPQTLSIQTTVTAVGALTNTASVSGADQFDPSTLNNSASATETPL